MFAVPHVPSFPFSPTPSTPWLSLPLLFFLNLAWRAQCYRKHCHKRSVSLLSWKMMEDSFPFSRIFSMHMRQAPYVPYSTTHRLFLLFFSRGLYNKNISLISRVTELQDEFVRWQIWMKFHLEMFFRNGGEEKDRKLLKCLGNPSCISLSPSLSLQPNRFLLLYSNIYLSWKFPFIVWIAEEVSFSLFIFDSARMCSGMCCLQHCIRF